ncbi:hypothetical protein SCALM49S_05324 [Streptomyces californicus]
MGLSAHAAFAPWSSAGPAVVACHRTERERPVVSFCHDPGNSWASHSCRDVLLSKSNRRAQPRAAGRARQDRSGAHASPSCSLPVRARRVGRAAAVLAAAGLLVLGASSAAHADPPGSLPQNAGGYGQTCSPAYDYDGDGCYATPAIGPDGTLAPGLKTTGAINGSCRDRWDLDNSQTYARSLCNNGWCGIVYASYFEKDQAVHGSGLGGHRHDFEHVISWVNQASNQVDHVSTTRRGTVRSTRARRCGSKARIRRPSTTRTGRARTSSGSPTATTSRRRTTTAPGATPRSSTGTVSPAPGCATSS